MSISNISKYFEDHSCLEAIADRHEQKLKLYFSSGRGAAGSDVSTLINETRDISVRLKEADLVDRARKFDSYIDVLTYGNHTLDESIHDAENLVKNPKPQKKESTVCKYLNKWF